jgi:phosphocarrier protein HPr
MLQREVTIINQLGLHARAAAKLVTLASRYNSEIHVARGDRSVNAKSIMGVMMLAAARGTLITLSAHGKDEAAALDALCQLVADRFGEEA